MKAERRHELQTNVLADWLAQKIEIVKPYGRLIVGAMGVLFVLAGVWSYMANRQFLQEAVAWQEFYAAVERQNESQLLEVAQRYDGTEAGLWASYRLADMTYNQGARELFDDRKEANELLLTAQSKYEDVVSQAKKPFLKQRAIFGLAQSLEARNDLKNAKRWYDELAESWPDSALGNHASQAAQRLRNQESFYDWFSDQQPKPAVSLTGDSSMEFGGFGEPGEAGGDTSFLDDLPDGGSGTSEAFPGPDLNAPASGPAEESVSTGSQDLNLDAPGLSDDQNSDDQNSVPTPADTSSSDDAASSETQSADPQPTDLDAGDGE